MAAPSTPEPSADPTSSVPAAAGEHESPSPAEAEHESHEPSLTEEPHLPDAAQSSRGSPGDG